MTATAERIDNLLQASRYLLSAARYRELRERNQNRPCVLLKPTLEHCFNANDNGTHYLASFGAVYATGDTPDEAYRNFDRAWISNPDNEETDEN